MVVVVLRGVDLVVVLLRAQMGLDALGRLQRTRGAFRKVAGELREGVGQPVRQREVVRLELTLERPIVAPVAQPEVDGAATQLP